MDVSTASLNGEKDCTDLITDTSTKDECSGNVLEVSKMVQKCISSQSYKSIECYLNDLSKDEKCPEKHSECKLLVKTLNSLYNSSNNMAEVRESYQLAFQACCSKFSNDFSLVYKILVIFLETTGFSFGSKFFLKSPKVQNTGADFNKSLDILSSLLDVLSRNKIELDCKVNGISFAEFATNLLKSIMVLSQSPNACVYQILMQLAEMKPLIIESNISEIVVYTMLSDNSTLETPYENLLLKIIEIFAKLHRIQALVAKIVPVLKTNLVDRQLNYDVEYTFRGETDQRTVEYVDYNADLMLPKAVMEYFSVCVTSLASWQVMNLFKTLLHHLENGVSELTEVGKEPSKLVYIEVLGTLTCWLLSSVRIAEHTVVEHTVQKFVEGLNELQIIMGKFGSAVLDREHNNVLVRSFLKMACNWADIYMILAYYSINETVEIKRSIDQDFTPFNLTYLHPYLSTKQWCLLSERIANFGEKPSKELMQKLIIQKLKGVILFDSHLSEKMLGPILKHLCSNFDEDVIDIFTDKFVINTILPKMPSSFIVTLSEALVKDPSWQLPQVYDSEIITHGILCVLVAKLHKHTRQKKRKLDEADLRKTLLSRMIAELPADVFLNPDFNQSFDSLAKILTTSIEDDENTTNISINPQKIEECFGMLRKLPVIFCPESTTKLLTLLLMATHQDLKHSNCDVSLVAECESTIIGLVQQCRFTFLDLFGAPELLDLIVKNYRRYDELFTCFANNIFKTSVAIEAFSSGVDYLKSKINKDSKYLACAIILLNMLTKVKRSKMPAETKTICQEYKSTICNKIVKHVERTSPSHVLVEPFALTVKNGYFDELKPKLKEYAEFCLADLNRQNLQGSLLLFTTILHNKSVLKEEFDEDFALRIWDSLRSVTLNDDVLEMYDQLVVLITASIANEKFSQITSDLLKITDSATTNTDSTELIKMLKTWSGIISSNFNPHKTRILQEAIESLLHKLILLRQRRIDYDRELFHEITRFEVCLIQTVQFHLTPAMMDCLILSPTFLLSKAQPDNFSQTFEWSISILESLLKHRNPLVMDRLSAYLGQYRVALERLCAQSDTDLNLEPSGIQTLSDCAHKFEKLVKSLVLNQRDMARISSYLIADILKQYEQKTLYPDVKLHLNNCIYSLVSLCDNHSVEFLCRVLSEASTEMFKVMYHNYKKYYRFTGKI